MIPHKPFTIIVADDDQDDRELLRSLFSHNDRFTLIGCLTSGIEVLDEIVRKKNVPDILLIDMYMPFFTGVEVVKKIDENGSAPDLQKFIISTTINTVEEEKNLNNPSVKFLTKPVTLAEIDDLPGIILEHLNLDNHLRI